MDTARAEVDWLDDEDAALIGAKDVASAVGLSLISGGGGHFYVGDNVTGLGLTLAALGALFVGPFLLPPLLAVLVLFGVLGGSAALAAKKVKKVNHFVLLRSQHDAAIAGHPTHKLLSAMIEGGALPPQVHGHGYAQPHVHGHAQPQPSPVMPHSPHSELIDKLRKLIHLRDAHMITELEHADRKIDLLAAVATGATRDQIDEMLFELLPLLQEGTLTSQDVEFVKSLGV